MMPYSCSLDRGRLKLEPAPERTYAIVGPREERPYTFCPPGTATDCRTLMVHKFSISCAGGPVPWLRVAAALKNLGFGRTWKERGRLNIVRDAAPADTDARPCLSSAEARAKDCLPWRPAPPKERMVLPEGFAPVSEIGARLLSGTQSITTSSISRDTSPSLQLVRYGEAVAREALLPPGAGLGEMQVALADLEWSKVVEVHDLSADAAAALWPLPAWLTAVLVLGTGLAARIGVAFRRLGPAVLMLRIERGLGMALEAFSRPRLKAELRAATGDAALDNAVRQVLALLERTERAVGGLKRGMPLRDVLEHEAGLVRQRLSALTGTAATGNGRAAAQLRLMIRDLERVLRIAECASRSVEGDDQSIRIPRTKSEAYHVLGVNPDVNDGILKKIVDGLRLTWHPDHAKDERDRSLREDRIKQINIAWELINGKRQAA